MVPLGGSTTLLTGASRGLGALIAPALAAEGTNLVLAARDARKLEHVAAQCASFNVAVRAVAADVSLASDRERLVCEAGRIDILINNAAIQKTRALVDQTAGDVESQLVTDLIAPIELTRMVLPGMIERRRGVIVNVSSMSGKVATPYNAIYAAAKHGLNGFTASLRHELQGTGVHAGVVCPSFVGETGMWANSGQRAPAMMREIKPEQVVRAVFAVLEGAEQVLVTPRPVRPLLALRELFPAIEGFYLRRMGILDALRGRAKARS
jgi:short-subunit dehydrogenase